MKLFQRIASSIDRAAPAALAGFCVLIGVAIGEAGHGHSWTTLIPFLVAFWATDWAADRREVETLRKCTVEIRKALAERREREAAPSTPEGE